MADRYLCRGGACGLNILLLAVGKAAGPEKALTERYVERAAKAGRAMGLTGFDVRELPDGDGPQRADREAASILAKRGKGVLIALDERGKALSSEEFAAFLKGFADDARDVTFAIGGADGHPPALREAADHVLSLSTLTLPHQLARAMLAEQIYRAVTLCIGHPYHRV